MLDPTRVAWPRSVIHFDVSGIAETWKCHEHDLFSVAVLRFHPLAFILAQITTCKFPSFNLSI
jgi:hypothetical protein